MIEFPFPKELRNLIIDALPEDISIFCQPPDLGNTFIPAGHARALQPDSMLVIGIRGAGKSFWWTVLQSEDHRQMVADLMPKSGIDRTTRVSVGFGERSSPDEYPGKDTFAQLIRSYEPRQIWRTVALRQVIKSTDGVFPGNSKNWSESIKWVVEHPEDVDRLLYNADQYLDNKREYLLILFDALDRIADDWPEMLKIIRGLLQFILEFRSCHRIRPKAFLRPDHLEDPITADFADSSKILSRKVELKWPRTELYGLLWQYLGNEQESGEIFREGCRIISGISWNQYRNVWAVPEELRIEEEVQRKIFHAITGPWMGRDRRRGFPYLWLPNHLGDARGQVSPRSFLAAIRYAADENLQKEYQYALHYENIKRGVRDASRIRVQEMQEDYPWVNVLMKPLSGMTVPCRFEEIARRWEEKNILEHLKDDIDKKEVKLPPMHLVEGVEGLRQDLEALGVFEGMRDGRVNMPDVYRLGFGLGRKGGLKTVGALKKD